NNFARGVASTTPAYGPVPASAWDSWPLCWWSRYSGPSSPAGSAFSGSSPPAAWGSFSVSCCWFSTSNRGKNSVRRRTRSAMSGHSHLPAHLPHRTGRTTRQHPSANVFAERHKKRVEFHPETARQLGFQGGRCLLRRLGPHVSHRLVTRWT